MLSVRFSFRYYSTLLVGGFRHWGEADPVAENVGGIKAEGVGRAKKRVVVVARQKEGIYHNIIIGSGASVKDGGGMCMGGEAYYNEANIMICTAEKRGCPSALYTNIRHR